METNRRIAGAPISWGVSEVPDWGYQMEPQRVLQEASEVGLSAMETGPEGYLSRDPEEARAMLDRHGLRLVGGFLPLRLHVEKRDEAWTRTVQSKVDFLSAAGADHVIVAAAAEQSGYDEAVDLDQTGWDRLFRSLERVEEMARGRGLSVAVHHHYGTYIERKRHLDVFLSGCEVNLCLDTGHLAVGGMDPVEITGNVAERVNLVHLKDVNHRLSTRVAERQLPFSEGVEREMFLPLGGGDLNLSRIVRRMESAGYDGFYVIEQDRMLDENPPPGEGPVVDVRESYRFVRNELT